MTRVTEQLGLTFILGAIYDVDLKQFLVDGVSDRLYLSS